MDLSTVINALFLCLFNVALMIAGILVNSMVIISLWRSSQLRKKLCYFTILVLSCFDLAVVVIMHPIQISSTISVFVGKYNYKQEVVRLYIAKLLTTFSMFALFVLNIERFLALTYPFFHQTSVTKRRLIFLMGALMILCISLTLPSHLNYKMVANVLSTISIAVFLLLFIYLNYKMFKIARSKRINETVEKSSQQERKRPNLQFKRFSTCSLTVFCFFICSGPQLIFGILRLTSNRNTSFHELVFYNLWTSTFLYMNSTFNCLIFFWKNSILRREGINIAKRFRSARFCRDCFSNDVLPMELDSNDKN